MAEERKIQLAGSNFTKLVAERKPEFKGKLSMKTDIQISSIEKFKPEGTKQESLKIGYAFKIDYADLGEVTVEGVLFVLADPKTQKELLKSWKDKKFDSTANMAIMNLILQKASVKAFSLEEELGLPIHIRLPTLQAKKE